jgi:hypothetical protein
VYSLNRAATRNCVFQIHSAANSVS